MSSYPELEEAQRKWRYHPPSDLLQGRVLLVTGASSGIGRVAARCYALYGANVVLLGRNQALLESLFDCISAETETDPAIVPVDLETLTEASANELADHISDHYGTLNGILHNAGLLGSLTPIAHYDVDLWQRVMQVNATAPFILTKALFPLLDESGDASVVFTTSGVGNRGRAYWGAYAVSKFALEGLSQVLADETETAGRIRVNTLNPGATRTTMRAAAVPGEDPAELPPPEAHMDLYLYLMGADSHRLHGTRIDARNWSPEGL